RVRGVLSLYTALRKNLDNYGCDIHARFKRACKLAKNSVLNGPFYTYGFYDYNEMQYRLLLAVANKNNVVVFFPAGEDNRYRFAARTLEKLEKGGFKRAGLSGKSHCDKPDFQPSLLLLEASDEEEEASAIVRLILKKIGEEKVALRDIGVVYPSYENFAPLKEVLEEAEIPYFISSEPVMENNQLFRAVDLLLDMLSGQTKRKRLVEFLVSAPLEVPSQYELKADPFLLWVRKSAEFGLVGEEGWIEENDALVDLLSKRVESPDADDAVLSAKIVGDVLKRLLDAKKALEEKLTWQEMSSRLSALFRNIFKADSGVDDLCLFIENFSGFDSASPPVSFPLFKRIVKALVSNSNRKRGAFLSEGITLLTLDQARGLSFEVLFLAGLTDGNIPGGIRQDPFLKDSERARLNELTSGNIFLQKKMERLAEQELVFTLATGSATRELICSMPLFEASSGKKRIKSFFLESFENREADSSGDKRLHRKRVTRNKMPERDEEILSIDEFDYSQALLFRASSGGQFPSGRFFAKSIKMLKNRHGMNRFTPWDGVFESKSAREGIRSMLVEKDYSFSATSMERYAKCPFSFFMNYFLGVESIEEPERIVSINSMQRGSIVHNLLESLYRNLDKENLLPLQNDKWQRISQILRKTAGIIFAEYSEENFVGFGLLWEIEKQEMERSVEMFLEKELEEKGGYTPVSFEKSFGFGGKNVEIELPGKKKIRFRGKIDRIDFKGNEGFRVIDYKTGKLKGKDNDLNGGNYLQLPVYLLGASCISGRPVESGVAEYRKVNKKGGKSSVKFSGTELENDRAEFNEILRIIISGIEDGLFFAFPSRDNCKFCPFASVCPAGKTAIFKKKAVFDDRCRDYLEMKGLLQGERDE
ncbi:PD-(D/E)XK nuclease family protein, partial [bacterium]|nr:PD-(D/E)XK nuclease family protein [bacterium]